MRKFTTAALAGLLLVSLSGEAEARRSGGSSSQNLLFVDSTKIEIDGAPYALCHLVKDDAILFINYLRRLEGYALAANKCNSDQYIALTAEALAGAKAAGEISQSVPDEPELSAGAMIEGHWGWALVVLALGLFGVRAKKSRDRRNQRQAMMGSASPAAAAILDAMCHAAKADGHVADAEVAGIAAAAREMTGESFAPEMVRQMAELAEAAPKEGDFKRLVKGRTEAEKEVMMRGVLFVAASDGTLDGKEQKFVGMLAKAMKMRKEKIHQLLAEAANARQQRAAS
ncbi:DUF533 domain-containing protein [Leisingera sp. SS27]|uniref:tellurite resistance TerB family protein n=1 Tax=Leisingera sp. SS27 TaxID=2979462 RepID=UPI0023309914|nr:DUF533 domain-containing protein [Leisingera sp. SS27]MDC0658413.1 DUF533 domain-containing protein [Leisingera sp. SS27]